MGLEMEHFKGVFSCGFAFHWNSTTVSGGQKFKFLGVTTTTGSICKAAFQSKGVSM
jgi:hypothetical protein